MQYIHSSNYMLGTTWKVVYITHQNPHLFVFIVLQMFLLFWMTNILNALAAVTTSKYTVNQMHDKHYDEVWTLYKPWLLQVCINKV